MFRNIEKMTWLIILERAWIELISKISTLMWPKQPNWPNRPLTVRCRPIIARDLDQTA